MLYTFLSSIATQNFSGASVAVISQVLTASMMKLLMVGNLKIRKAGRPLLA